MHWVYAPPESGLRIPARVARAREGFYREGETTPTTVRKGNDIMTTIFVIAGLFTIGTLAALAPAMVETYRKFRGTRLVTCPENRETAAVRVDTVRAAATGAVGNPTIRLQACSRWPELHDCDQECA